MTNFTHKNVRLLQNSYIFINLGACTEIISPKIILKWWDIFLAGNILAGNILAGNILAGNILEGNILAGNILEGNILAGNIFGAKMYIF
jgi:hypothetical protein